MLPPSSSVSVLANTDLAAVQAEIALKEKHVAFLNAATSDNTRRTYQSAVRHFVQWGGMLPADEATILRYIVTFAESLNPRTIRVRLTALAQWHIHQGFQDPTNSSTMAKTMAGVARQKGRPKNQAKALPVEDLDLISVALVTQGTLKAIRDNALLQIGFFGGFRRSELVHIDMRDLDWDKEGLTIMLPRSKTDQTGEGIAKAIPHGSLPRCPVSALRTWLDQSKLTEGAVFRSVSRWGHIGTSPLDPASVNAILASAAELAGLSYVPELASHSLRRGMATSSYRAGAGIREIKRQGGWRHDGTVHGYIEEATRFQENAAGVLLGKQVKSRSGSGA
jgi:integrase